VTVEDVVAAFQLALRRMCDEALQDALADADGAFVATSALTLSEE
jgi:hypothetical protein